MSVKDDNLADCPALSVVLVCLQSVQLGDQLVTMTMTVTMMMIMMTIMMMMMM